MSKKDTSNYLLKGRQMLLVVVVLLFVLSFIPPQTVGEVRLRRANIFSDLYTFEDVAPVEDKQPLLAEEEVIEVDFEEVSEQVEDVVETVEETSKIQTLTFEWSTVKENVDELGQQAKQQRERDSVLLEQIPRSPKVVEIEDYSPQQQLLKNLYDTLLFAQRPIRIAVLGDSFIEGDILTADLRENLQTLIGGGGAGFAPLSSPLTAFRRTIQTKSEGWTSSNIMQYKRVPEDLRSMFYVSGWLSTPSAMPSTRWKMTSYRQHLSRCSVARIFFLSPSNSEIQILLNDSLHHVFHVEGGDALRQIVIHAPKIEQVEFKLLSGKNGFVGYGAVFEQQGRGVVVDNYSIRSNSGHSLFRTNPRINAQMGQFLHYDLIILQYGLNMMQKGVIGYSRYTEQVGKMVQFLRECFPEVGILILGVSDRSMKNDAGQFERMDALEAMTQAQRQAAMNSQTAFWSIAEAMEMQGGMAEFVANGWAGKDYTHINYGGGRQVAQALFDALRQGLENHEREVELMKKRLEMNHAVVDSATLQRVNDQMLSPQKLDVKLQNNR